MTRENGEDTSSLATLIDLDIACPIILEQSRDTDESEPSEIFSELSKGEDILDVWWVPPLLGKIAQLLAVFCWKPKPAAILLPTRDDFIGWAKTGSDTGKCEEECFTISV